MSTPLPKNIAYKLTDQKMQTYEGFQWELNKPVPKLDGKGSLCTNQWYHAYKSPFLAVFLNPIHAKFTNPRLFLAKVGRKNKSDNEIKLGYTSMTLIKELELPKITTTQKIAFGILCVKEVFEESEWNKWADAWLSEKVNAAYHTGHIANITGTYIEGRALTVAAAYIMESALNATHANASTDYAIRTATFAARAVASAARAAAYQAKPLPLISLSEKALTFF